MTDSPKIPFGYKQVEPYTQTRKGDGKWDGTRFRRVKKDWPRVDAEEVVIRRCEAVQQELPCPACGEAEPCSHDFAARDRQLEDIGRKMGTGCRIFEFE